MSRKKPIVSLVVAAAVACLASVAAPACDGATGSAGDDTLPPPPPTTTTTAPDYAVPATIDPAYVARVMAALDKIYGDAVRHLAKTRQVDEAFLTPLVAIHNPRIFTFEQDLWVKTQATGFEGLRAQPDDPRTRIDRLIRADAECVLIEGDRSFAALFDVDDPTNHDRYVALTPLRADRNPAGLNPTRWTINFAGQRPDGTVPSDACAAQ